MQKFAVITAGGIGKRMENEIPKQFLLLGDMPILMHTIKRFYDYDHTLTIIVSLPSDYIKFWKKLCRDTEFIINHKIVSGGKTRFHSIKNALKVISEDCLVAIHDGVRPLVSLKTIDKTFKVAEEKGNAVSYQDIFFSIRKLESNESISVKRSQYKEIQTPQTFKIEIIKKAYKLPYEKNFTDDASVLERLGEKIHLVEGNRENIKITTEQDLLIANVLKDSVF